MEGSFWAFGYGPLITVHNSSLQQTKTAEGKQCIKNVPEAGELWGLGGWSKVRILMFVCVYVCECVCVCARVCVCV
jgi:hypothetical protein